MLLVQYVLASIFYLISSFITFSLYYFLLKFKILLYFHFRSSIVSFGCCSSYCKVPVPQLGWLQLVFTKTIKQCWYMESLPGFTGRMRCAHVTLCSPSAGGVIISWGMVLGSLSMSIFICGCCLWLHCFMHVCAVSSCSSCIWSQSKSSLTLLLNQRRMLLTCI